MTTKRNKPQCIAKNGFVIYVDAAVVYEGRAYSTLERGHYLIIGKPDRSFMVMGGRFIPPLNYQGPGATLIHHRPGTTAFQELQEQHFSDLSPGKLRAILESTSCREHLYVAVHRVISQQLLRDWSTTSIELSRSEAELRDHIATNANRFFPALNIISVQIEVPTPYGNVDVYLTALARGQQTAAHIIEVKRRQASIAACGQVARYGRHLREIDELEVYEYVAAPTISRNAELYCQRHGQRYIRAVFPD
jgi:RecB family endonuclease NucS